MAGNWFSVTGCWLGFMGNAVATFLRVGEILTIFYTHASVFLNLGAGSSALCD